MPTDRNLDYSMLKCEPIFPEQGGMSALAFAPNLTIARGTILGQISTASANEVQTINYTGTWAAGDTMTISIVGIDGGTYSTTLIMNATPAFTNAAVKIAIDALLAAAGYIGATVTMGGGPGDTDQTVTFGGTAAAWDMPLMTAAYETAGNGVVQVDATTAGYRIGVWIAYDDDGTDDGRRVARAIAVYSFRTDMFGRVVYASAGQSPEFGDYRTTAPAWFKGRFRTTDLVGLDANGIADLGRLESGTLADGIVALV